MPAFFRSVATLMCAVALLALARPARAKTLRITSSPSGARVEMNGLIVGKTPFAMKMPGGYFHKTHTIFGAKLRHAIVVRISLDGYATKQLTITEGPYVWRSFSGRSDGNYWLLKADHFELILRPASDVFTGQPEISRAKMDANSEAGAKLPAELIATQSDAAIVRVEGDANRGTGFFVTDTGVIATNRHVVAGQQTIYVVTKTLKRLTAQVVYIDPDEDLALLKVHGSGFPHLTLATLNAVERGESVVAIGNPGGGMPDTITRGIVSGIGKSRLAGSGTWIQTDAAINPGNSGGPLLDSEGRVVGITAVKIVGTARTNEISGLNFALSAQDLIDVLRRFYPPEEKSTKEQKEDPGSATVKVLSEPTGADIYVDGEFVGDTPSVLHLSAGAHAVEIEAVGKQSWKRRMNVLKGSKVTLNARLAPKQ